MVTYINHYTGKITIDEYFERCRAFHGSLAPGLVAGGLMVDWALECMGLTREFDAVVETRKCLPDAVQLLTKCSIGNGWLKIMDWGKLAITMYDHHTREGTRVYLDCQKLDRYPRVKSWALHERSKKENPLEPLIEEMVRGGRDILTCQEVIINKISEKLAAYGQPRICSTCGEAYRSGSDAICQGCLQPFCSIRRASGESAHGSIARVACKVR